MERAEKGFAGVVLGPMGGMGCHEVLWGPLGSCWGHGHGILWCLMRSWFCRNVIQWGP